MSGNTITEYNWETLKQWNVYGTDNVGKITKEGEEENKFYYLKDHLGSIREVIDEDNIVVNAQDYDMWGFLLENRSYYSTDEKYKFTGKERDIESSYDYFGARYYMSRIGRWGCSDPFVDEYPSHSPYNYALNNTLIIVDPNGLQAWEINAEWTFEMINEYHDYASELVKEYKENGTRFTCEDLALSILIDFASDNGLPVSIQNDEGLFTASSDDFNNVTDFKNEVLKTTGASDLTKYSNNTFTIKTSNVKTGDLFLLLMGGVNAQHTQVVTSVSSGSYGIHQGNTVAAPISWYMRSSDPSSPWYQGVLIQTGVYEYNSKTKEYDYKRQGPSSRNSKKFTNSGETMNSFQAIPSRWNYYNW